MYEVVTRYRVGSFYAAEQTAAHVFRAAAPGMAARYAESYIRRCYPDASVLYIITQDVQDA